MAIRYNPKYNAEIRRIVHNFNQNVKRANEAGYAKTKLPNPVKVSELKARFKTRSELNKELNRLNNFSRQVLKNQIETEGGASTTKWNINYLSSHTAEARKHFKERQKLYEKKIKDGFPGEKMSLDNINAKLDILNKDLSSITENELKSYQSTINEYMKFPNRSNRGYRGFLSEVDWVMGNIGIGEEDKKEFFDKFKQLSPEQFQYLYDNSELINKIFMMIDSPSHGNSHAKEPTLNTDTVDAKQQINTLMEEVDLLIEEAQENA